MGWKGDIGVFRSPLMEAGFKPRRDDIVVDIARIFPL
jgi:hypothetical protein